MSERKRMRASLYALAGVGLAVVVAIGTLSIWARPAASHAAGHQGKPRPSLGTVTPPPDYLLEKKVPPRLNVFDLNLAQTRRYSASQNFKLLGHSYLKGPWLTQFARNHGMGAGFNTLRIDNGIAYLAGYNSPATLFGVLIVDVRNPRHMKPLSFIPCNTGARCAYLRLDTEHHILVVGDDTNSDNPQQPPAGTPVKAGFGFYDVSDPRHPKELSFVETRPNGATHGFDLDGRYVYACANDPKSKASVGLGSHELKVIDYGNPQAPRVVGSVHIMGQHVGEQFAPGDRRNPDGSAQKVWCHEITVDRNLVYIAWRDAGFVIVNVADKAHPTIVSRVDYVPPFNGGSLGAAHSLTPAVANSGYVPPSGAGRPKLAALTDEIFDCPPGFGRMVDLSDLAHPQILSSFRIPAIDDNFNYRTGKFACQPGQQSVHMIWYDERSPSLMYVSWYDQGARVWNIENPFQPKEIGYYISPQYAAPDRAADRQTREVYQDSKTGLIYVTDGNGGGLTVLRWTGPIPLHPPLPAAR